MHPALEKQLEELIRANLRDDRRSAPSLPLWSRLRELGTKLWLDTGDMDEAARLWTDDFTALTTNNTLLNREIQKGLYDTWIPDVLRMIRSPETFRVGLETFCAEQTSTTGRPRASCRTAAIGKSTADGMRSNRKTWVRMP